MFEKVKSTIHKYGGKKIALAAGIAAVVTLVVYALFKPEDIEDEEMIEIFDDDI